MDVKSVYLLNSLRTLWLSLPSSEVCRYYFFILRKRNFEVLPASSKYPPCIAETTYRILELIFMWLLIHPRTAQLCKTNGKSVQGIQPSKILQIAKNLLTEL